MKTNRRSFVGAASALALPDSSAAQPQGSELRVAACQILTYPDTRRSAAKICSWIEKAAQEKIDVVAFPEAVVCGYCCDPEYWKSAQPSDFLAAEETIASTARRLDVAVVLGTAHWDGGNVYNSVLAIDRDGRARGRYAKTFLAESWPTPGNKLPILTLAGVKSCFIICHDIRYPELVRLPAAAGAQICYYVSNESGLVEEHKLSAYRAMPISRATENSIYLVMANAPADPKDMLSPSQSHGSSKIVHPNGTVLNEAGYFQERLVSSTIDLKAADRAMARRAAAEGSAVSQWIREGIKLVKDNA